MFSIAREMQRQNVKKWWLQKRPRTEQDEDIARFFSRGPAPADAMSSLLDYFWSSHLHYSVLDGTSAFYPGMPSIYGARNDGIEGCSRLLPLWAAACSQSSEHGKDMQAHVKKVLLSGTDPQHRGYWGTVGDKDTLICEGADIALALWLSKDSVWASLDNPQQQQILAWLQQIPDKQTVDNNWHLFVVLVDLIIATLAPAHAFKSQARYQRIKTFYRGQGCFTDGPAGHIDLYNAWGFHYSLFWLNEIDPTFDNEFISEAITAYCDWYKYLFVESGFPLFGRSLCYRFAVASPLLAACHLRPDSVSPGLALHAMLANFRYFICHGGLHQGRPTQGVFGDDIRWLDPYSGPASSFWSLRPMVMYYYLYRHIDWQCVTLDPLPAMTQCVNINVPAAKLAVTTVPDESVVYLDLLENDKSIADISIAHQSTKEQLRQCILGIGQRPDNNLQKHGIRRFDSTLTHYTKK